MSSLERSDSAPLVNGPPSRQGSLPCPDNRRLVLRFDRRLLGTLTRLMSHRRRRGGAERALTGAAGRLMLRHPRHRPEQVDACRGVSLSGRARGSAPQPDAVVEFSVRPEQADVHCHAWRGDVSACQGRGLQVRAAVRGRDRGAMAQGGGLDLADAGLWEATALCLNAPRRRGSAS